MVFLELLQETRGSSRVLMGILGNLLNCVKGVTTPLKFLKGLGIAFQALQNWASSRIKGGIPWFLSSCSGNLGVLLKLGRGHQGTSRVASGKSSLLSSCMGVRGLLSSHYREIGSHLALRGESCGFSHVAARSLGFLLSCDGDFRELLMLPQGIQVSFLVVSRCTGVLSNHCRGIGPHLTLRGECRVSQVAARALGLSRVATGTSRNFSCCLREVRPPFKFEGAPQDFYRVTAGE